MKVFVSCSGGLSKEVAATIRGVFPNVLQGLEIFLSDADLESGVRWFGEIEQQLATSGFGILVVTRQNRDRPWMLFEAGALAKGVSKNHVTPLLVDLGNADLIDPLGQFQTRSLEKGDVRKLLSDLNATEGGKLTNQNFERTFEKWWPDMERGFSQARAKALDAAGKATKPRQRSPEEQLLAQMLSDLRGLSRQLEASRSLQNNIWDRVQRLPVPFSLDELRTIVVPGAEPLTIRSLATSGGIVNSAITAQPPPQAKAMKGLLDDPGLLRPQPKAKREK